MFTLITQENELPLTFKKLHNLIHDCRIWPGSQYRFYQNSLSEAKNVSNPQT